MLLTRFLRPLTIRKKINPTRLGWVSSRLSGTINSFDHAHYEELITNSTVITNDHLTPELKLFLITPECDLWHCKPSEANFSDDPFWGIYWPGGQALGRYILDNKELFNNKNIIDIGAGSGACAIAAAKCGANIVLANDIDPVSLYAIKLNSKLNNIQINVNENNLIGKDIDLLSVLSINSNVNAKWDIVLIGDMFYDSEFSFKLFKWLIELVKKGKEVLVGDPGRHALEDLKEMKNIGSLIKLSEYSLKDKEYNGFANTAVFKVGTDRDHVFKWTSRWEIPNLISSIYQNRCFNNILIIGGF